MSPGHRSQRRSPGRFPGRAARPPAAGGGSAGWARRAAQPARGSRAAAAPQRPPRRAGPGAPGSRAGAAAAAPGTPRPWLRARLALAPGLCPPCLAPGSLPALPCPRLRARLALPPVPCPPCPRLAAPGPFPPVTLLVSPAALPPASSPGTLIHSAMSAQGALWSAVSHPLLNALFPPSSLHLSAPFRFCWEAELGCLSAPSVSFSARSQGASQCHVYNTA